MAALIAKLLVWFRLLTPGMVAGIVNVAWEACKDGKVTSRELGRIILDMDFEFRVPFVQYFRTE